MPDEKTSAEIASLASKYLNFSTRNFTDILAAALTDPHPSYNIKELCADIRSLAASALTQAEDKPHG